MAENAAKPVRKRAIKPAKKPVMQAAKKPMGAPKKAATKPAFQGAKPRSPGGSGKGPSKPPLKPLKVPKGLLTSNSSGTHKLIVGEFVVCIILIAATPPLTQKPGDGRILAPSGVFIPEPPNQVYNPNDFVRLSAVCALFFVLALISNTPKWSKLAGMFGGLVTLGVLYSALPVVTKIGNVFINAQIGTIPTAPAGTATIATPTFTPSDLNASPTATTPSSTGAAITTPNATDVAV